MVAVKERRIMHMRNRMTFHQQLSLFTQLLQYYAINLMIVNAVTST